MKHITILALLSILTGCAASTIQPITGDKSAGTITMGYEYGLYVREPEDEEIANGVNIAGERCRSWGYEGAERFGHGRKECTKTNAYGNCLGGNVLIDYQCL